MTIIKPMATISNLRQWIRGLAMSACLLGLFAGLVSCAGPAKQAEGVKDEGYCLWLLWTKDPKLAAQAKSQIAKGIHFTVAARNLAQMGKKKVSLNSRCLPASKLGPQVLAQALELKIGQVSPPFELDKGTAWVMRTTEVHRLRGKALYEKGEYAKAEKELLADLKLHPAKAPIWHLVALCRSARQDYDGALNALDTALKWAPDSPNLLQDKATTLVYMGQAGQAVHLYEMVLTIEPQNALAMSNLAWALALERRELKRARALAQKALETSPQNARFWTILGLVQKAQGDHPAALVSFHRAARLNPNAPQVKDHMVQSLMALNSQDVGRLLVKRTEPAPLPQKPEKKPAPTAAEKRTSPKIEIEPFTKAMTEISIKAARAPRAESFLRTPDKTPVPAETQTTGRSENPPAAAPPAPKLANQNLVFLQVGSHLSRDQARREIGFLKNQGHRPFIKDWKDAKGRVWLRVVLGPFSSVAQAVRTGSKLRRQNVIVSYKVLLRDRAWFAAPRARAVGTPVQPAKRPGRAFGQHIRAQGQGLSAAKSAGQECYLVVGSYRDRELAKQSSQTWRQQGFQASLRAWRRGDKGIWHRVLLGPYVGRNQALTTAEQLKQKGLVSTYLLVESIAPPFSQPGRP